MGKYFLKFSYIGSHYRGLQKNVVVKPYVIYDPDTIQGALEIALSKVVPKCLNWPKLTLSSRTDIGVHALCNACHVNLNNNYNLTYNSSEVLRQVNRYLGKCKHEIRLLECIPVKDDFHARYCVKSRTYVYRFMRTKNPNNHKIPIIENLHCYNFRSDNFDIEKLKQATKLFIGRKDFKTFSGSCITDKPIKYVRNLNYLTVEKTQSFMPLDPLSQDFEFWSIVINSKSFLYKQVRRIVTTLLAASIGKITLKDINIMLQVPNTNNWFVPLPLVPAHGLYLTNVEYCQKELDEYIIKDTEYYDSESVELVDVNKV